MADRVEVRCSSPLAWRLGWAQSLLVFVGIFATVLSVQASARGYDRALMVTLPLVVAFLGAYVWPSKVTLLEDGLAYRRYGFTRFVPYSKIRATESVQRLGSASKERGSRETVWTVHCALRLHLEGEETLDIGTGSDERKLTMQVGSWVIGQYGDYGAFTRNGFDLKRGLDARIEAFRDGPEPATPMAEGLVRGEKTIAEWLAAIEAAAPAKGDAYRGAEGAHEALWRVLEDAGAPREARAAAAIALRSHLDEDGRNRMRVVVDSCESPKLRVAIETALDVGTTETEGEPRLRHALEQASLPREDS